MLKYNFAISSLINDSVKKENITLNTSMNVYEVICTLMTWLNGLFKY